MNAGFNWSSRNINTWQVDPTDPNNIFLTGLNAPPYKNNRNGFIGGVQVGYLQQFNQFIVGAELDFMGASVSRRASTISPEYRGDTPGFGNFATSLNPSTQVEQSWLGTARLRAGLSLDRVLVYATGGLAYGNAKSSTTIARPFSSNNVNFQDAQFNYGGLKDITKLGYTLGAGVEYALTDNWIIRGEYLYYNLGNITNIAIGTTSTVNGVTTQSQSTFLGYTKTTIDGNIVRAAISYKF